MTTDEGFEWQTAHMDHMYPSADILAEIGRVAIAAARVDRELALVLLALKISVSFEELIKLSSAPLCKMLRTRIDEFFESDLHGHAENGLAIVRTRLDSRHAVMHSIWTPEDADSLFSVDGIVAVPHRDHTGAVKVRVDHSDGVTEH